MTELTTKTTYFRRPGRANTARTLELARARADALNVHTVLVATTGGETGRLVAQGFQDFDVIVVTLSTGFWAPDSQELTPENRTAIEAAGAQLLTCQHALGGVNRAVRVKLATHQLDEIIAHTLRLQGQGFKVVAEMALMAADAGLLRTDTPVLAIAGTSRGADTAVLLLPTNAQTFFDLKIIEIICRPSPAHPAFA
ncbi:MAG: hypothetical protein JRJ19_12890 [Deltaproteobacteria bacterium]|nr:hypothetical protein [Deltaproteobacteria bacterium]